MEVIVAAIITAAGSFLAGYWPQRIKRRRTEEDIRRAEAAVAQLNDDLLREGVTGPTEPGASYRVGVLEKATLFDENGDGNSTKTWRKVRTDQNFQNLKIPFRLRTVCKGTSLERPDVHELEGSGRTVNLANLTVQHQDDDQAIIEGEIVINGPIDPGTPPVHFRLANKFKKSFCTNREEMTEAYKNSDFKEEFSVQEVTAPTEQLLVKVTFPPSHHDLRPGPSPVVLFAGTELVHQGETQRVRHDLTFEDGVGKLTVRKPRMGLAYGVSWTPPRSIKGATAPLAEPVGPGS